MHGTDKGSSLLEVFVELGCLLYSIIKEDLVEAVVLLWAR